MPSTSGEPSQINVAKTIDLTQVSSDEEMEDDTGFQAAVAVKQRSQMIMVMTTYLEV